MLCKTTMRAALAHVLATVGILGAFGAGAAPQHPYAAESLSGTAPYTVKASVGQILLDVPMAAALDPGEYFLVVNFWPGTTLEERLATEYTASTATGRGDVVGTAGDATADPATMAVQPVVGHGTGFRFYTRTMSTTTTATPAVTGEAGEISPNNASHVAAAGMARSARGDEGDHSGMYRFVVPDGSALANLDANPTVRLELGNNQLAIDGPGNKVVDVYVYAGEDRSLARTAALAEHPDDVDTTRAWTHMQVPLFSVSSKIAAPTVDAYLATASVRYERMAREDGVPGGPFRGFTEEGESGDADVGTLAMITLNEAAGDFLDVTTGGPFTGTVNTGARVSVTAAAGAFGFGSGAGDGPNGEFKIEGDNPATEDMVETDHVLNAGGRPTAFKVSTSKTSCSGTDLTLTAGGMTINPLAATDPTSSADADGANAMVTGDGPFYFCVDVSMNEVAIPTVGDPDMMNGYMISVTPMHGTTAGPAGSGAGGAINRDGASINITYLSLDPAYSQRLVIVNRTARPATFWMDEFQRETGTVIIGEIRGTVDAMSRRVIDVQNVLSKNMGGQDRASGILNLTAPTENVDVMTVQVHPGTGQIDTTIY